LRNGLLSIKQKIVRACAGLYGTAFAAFLFLTVCMTQLQFAILNKEQKINIIKQEGAFLYVRNEAGIDIILYQIGNFYAEVFFEAVNNDKITIRSFDDTASLDVYLKEINISALQQLL
jgi:hypothetical protein